MVLGLKRGSVELYDHDIQWEYEAERTIIKLKEIVGDAIIDIQHVGSTSIKSIKAKPIIDIAIATDSFEEFLKYENVLQSNGFYYRPNVTIENQLLFACGSYYEETGNLQTHFIHVVLKDSIEWNNYLKFRDYLNAFPNIARDYERVKLELFIKYENDRSGYLKGKEEIINSIIKQVNAK